FDVPLSRSGHHRIRLRLTASDGLVVTLWDVSAERARDDAMGESEALMRKVVENAPVGFIVYDLDAKRLIFQSPKSREMFGHLDDGVGSSWYDETKRVDYLTELYATGRVDAHPVIGSDANNEPFPAHLSARVVKHRGHSVAISTTHDLTELKAQQDELAASRQRLLDAIGALDLGFVLFDAAGAVVLWNEQFARINAPLADALTEGADMATLQAEARELAHPEGAVGWTSDAYEFDLADGRSFAATRSDMSDGGSVLTFRDITAAKAAARELSRRREAAFQSEKLTALGELLAGVAHELNNPLSVVVGQALMLEEETTDPDVTRRISRISTAAERCSKIVKTFLAMARQQPFKTKATEMNAILETAVDVASMGVQAIDVQFDLRLRDGLTPVAADEDQMTQVFTNLMVNAAQAMHHQQDARIVIETQQTGGFVSATISDNGPGISDEQKARVFEPFYTTKDIGDGTGVGLALARQIVTAHGGEIDLGDAPGGGAAFTVRLPITEAASRVTVADKRQEQAAADILLVEDEADVAEIIIDVLKADGFNVQHAPSGLKALEILEGATFDVILSDLRMPGLTGRELLARITAQHPGLVDRMGFITGDAMSADAEAMRASANVRLIEKPVAPADLRALVANILKDTRP
ncbi:MAG: ATP-binding protein, partial [Pseudomonadota bacterium]